MPQQRPDHTRFDVERIHHLGHRAGQRLLGHTGRHRRPGPPDRRQHSGTPGRHRRLPQVVG